MEIRRWSASTPVAWKNGGGLTRELAGSPAGAGLSDFDWRISVADIERSGSFSSFAGVDRIIVLVEGREMILTVGGIEQPLTAFEPFAFSGDSQVSCAVPRGPTRDLNVMIRRGRCRAVVDVLEIDGWVTTDPRGHGEQLLVPVAGDLTAVCDDTDVCRLSPYDLLRGADLANLELRGSGRVARIEIWGPRDTATPVLPGYR